MANEATSWLNRGAASVMSALEEAARCASFSQLGMGQGTLSFSKINPDPFFNF
jgi:hypothetical protein